MKPGTVISRAEKAVDIGANDKLPSKVTRVPGKRQE